MNPVKNIASLAREKKSLNIVIFCSGEEKFVKLLAKSCPQHNFYVWTAMYDFYWTEEYCSVEGVENLRFLEPVFEDVSLLLGVDLIICQDRLNQYNTAVALSNNWHVPLVVINHTTPQHIVSHEIGRPPRLSQEEWNQISTATGSVNVFTSEAARKEWDTEGFVLKPWTDVLNTEIPKTVDDFIGLTRDLNETEQAGAQAICREHPVQTVDTEDMRCRVFLNLKQGSIPIEVLESMAQGIPVVSIHSAEMEEVVTHYQNGLLVHSIQEANQIIGMLMKNDHLLNKMREKAREKVEDYCKENFKTNFELLLDHATGQIYLR